jgi:hypothetical protein
MLPESLIAPLETVVLQRPPPKLTFASRTLPAPELRKVLASTFADVDPLKVANSVISIVSP